MQIGIVGGSTCTQEEANLAYRVGYLLGRAGHVLVCGGRGGVMEAACRGAKDAGGVTVGILPSEDFSEANEFVDIKIPTGMGFSRNFLVVRAAEAIISIGGRYGTLSELCFAEIFGKPVVSLKSWYPEREGVKPENIYVAENPEEAVELAIRLAGGGRR